MDGYIQMKYLIVIFLILLTGCQTLLTTTRTASEAIVVDAIVESGAPLDVISSISLNDEQIETLITAADRYKEFKRKWRDTITDPIFPSYMLVAFSADFANLTWHYRQVENIVVERWGEYTPAQQALLLNWRNKSRSLAVSTGEMIELGARNQALTNALDFGLLLLRMGM